LLNLIGPLGCGYTIPSDMHTALLVAGGLGVAPMPFLCEEAQTHGKGVEVYLGAKTASELSMVDVIKDLGVEVFISTEDGSLGKRGLVTEILLDRLEKLPSSRGVHLFSCGPNSFLQAMIAISEKRGIRGQVAIETMMGCGFGICVGCPVRVRGGDRGGLYKLTCVEGPVFDAMEIVLDD
ncbi:MAG: dihydroorotate dehydrogenase electron transfer subunit, partial [bacterium]